MKWGVSNPNIYLDFCFEASQNQDVFNSFRRNPVYNEILEHVFPNQGAQYLAYIEEFYPHLLNHIDKFVKQDTDNTGGPYIVEFYNGIKCSPTTLRYLKVLGDLEKHFGSLSDLNIVEIGGGYGGQCKIINDYFKPKNYQIIDDDKVLPLISKYLNLYNVNYTFEKLENIDLVISNYALNEMDLELQSLYHKLYISKTRLGYFTGVKDTFNLNLFESLKDRLTCYKETPSTHPDNINIILRG